MSMGQMTILDRRRVEAEFAKALLPELEKVVGREGATQVISRVATTLARHAGESFAAASDVQPPGLEELANLMPLWERDDALTLVYLERGAERLSFNVVRCRYAEMYGELGVPELGRHLSCQRDGEFCKGLNPNIQFERTQTIMQGASHCDFRYRLRRFDEDNI